MTRTSGRVDDWDDLDERDAMDVWKCADFQKKILYYCLSRLSLSSTRPSRPSRPSLKYLFQQLANLFAELIPPQILCDDLSGFIHQ